MSAGKNESVVRGRTRIPWSNQLPIPSGVYEFAQMIEDMRAAQRRAKWHSNPTNRYQWQMVALERELKIDYLLQVLDLMRRGRVREARVLHSEAVSAYEETVKQMRGNILHQGNNSKERKEGV